MSARRLIVGLGNPGPKYETTRHNIGFWVVDELVQRYGLGAGRGEKRAQTWDGNIKGVRVKLMKPLAFMNRSGESVRQLTDYYDIPVENLLVVHDDLDTPFGMLRMRQAGGHGGQNGIRSIVQHLGSKEFARLRFGIGRPPGRMDPVDFVLQPFKGGDAIRARELAGRAADAIEVWLSDGIDRAMTLYNGDAVAAGGVVSKRDLVEQLDICLRAHELAPSESKPLAKVIALQKKLGMIDQAVANHLKLARVFEGNGNTNLAIAEKVKAVAIRPALVEVQREIAQWYLAQDNPKKAVGRILILAQHYRDGGDIVAAMEEVELALSINPQHPKALNMRRWLQEATGSQ